MLLLGLVLFAAADVDDSALVRLSSGVAEQRAAVETLADDVARERSAARDELLALEKRRRDLAAKRAELQLLLQELRARAAVHDEQRRMRSAADDVERAPVVRAIERLRAQVAATPFRAATRLGRCDLVERNLAGRSAVASAAALWPVLRDEALLLSSVSRARQPLTLDGKPALVEVAQVGPLLFWKANDGRVGHVDAGVVVVDEASEARARLLLFFDALKRSRAEGVFLLPWSAPPSLAPRPVTSPQPTDPLAPRNRGEIAPRDVVERPALDAASSTPRSSP